MTDGALADMDVDELKEVVELLDDAGYHVRGIDSVRRTHNGVEWDITVEASNRSASLGEGAIIEDTESQDEADDEDVKEALEAHPEDHDEDLVEDIEEAVEDSNGDEDVQEDADDEDGDDGGLTTDELLEQWVEGELEDKEEIAKSSTDIGDELDIDGRAVPGALKRLDNYDVEKRESDEDHKGSIWAVTPVDGDDVEDTVFVSSGHKNHYHREPDCSRLSSATNVYKKTLANLSSDLLPCGLCCDGADETPDSESVPDGEFWCGYCGAGPHPTPDDVEAHHVEEDHAGEAVVLDEDPADDTPDTEESDSEPVVETDDHQIGDSLDDVEETSADGGAATVETDVDLPDGISADGLREFIEGHESIPYLGVIADKFGLEEGECRTILHKLGLYGDVIDATERKGGGY